jgi:glucose/arabinose dehydrogenase
MREIVRSVAAALSIACLAVSMAIVSSTGAFAQAKQAPKKAPAPAAKQQAAPPPQEAPMKQMALTEKQIEGVLAAVKDIEAITAKVPANAKPDPKVDAQLDAAAKKNGFASYAEYNDVTDNISMVMGGFDPATKQYVGAEAVLKAQIAAVQADKKMPAKDKKRALDEMTRR